MTQASLWTKIAPESPSTASRSPSRPYRFAPNWYAGVEARYHSVYPDFPNKVEREHQAVFFGPTLHWGGERAWFTATWLPQIGGSPSPGRKLDLGEYEKNEFRLKVGYNF